MTFTDPLLRGDIDLTVVLIVIGKTIVTFALLMVAVLFYIWFMRKVIADMQNRIGPSNAGPFGILQTLADGIKLFFKEQSTPRSADKPVFLVAPYLSILPAFLAFSIVPIGGAVSIAGHTTFLQLAELPVGVLWLLAMSGLGLYGVMLAGWSSGSKYPLLGSVRASAQLLSYEAAFGLAVVGVLIQSGTLSTRGIVAGQAWTGSFLHGLGQWYVRPAIVAFVIFLIAAIAETNHPPFDLVEAEQELVGGFHTEYTGSQARFPRRDEHDQRLGDAGLLVHAQAAPAALRHGVDQSHAPAPALRPADGPGLEVHDRGRVPLDHGVRGGGDRAAGGLEPLDRRTRGSRRRRPRVPRAVRVDGEAR